MVALGTHEEIREETPILPPVGLQHALHDSFPGTFFLYPFPGITMSASIHNGETYPGQTCSLFQLLYAAKRKLQTPMFGGRCVCNCNGIVNDN